MGQSQSYQVCPAIPVYYIFVSLFLQCHVLGKDIWVKMGVELGSTLVVKSQSILLAEVNSFDLRPLCFEQEILLWQREIVITKRVKLSEWQRYNLSSFIWSCGVFLFQYQFLVQKLNKFLVARKTVMDYTKEMEQNH